jgi:DNA repair protein RecN (Recombination protein N)
MITVLRLKNFALVDELTIHFSQGLTCLTGETGAGKSLLADAILMLLGGRSRAEFVRHGFEEAMIEAMIDISNRPQVNIRMRDLGLSDDADELCVKRVISREGRGRIYLNGSPITALMLQKITEGLLELVGQGEHQTLLRPEGQLELLDAFGGHAELRRRMADAYIKLRDLSERKRKLEETERERKNREEFVAYQQKEIEEAKLVPGEDVELTRDRERLRHVTRILSATRAAESILYSNEPSISEMLSTVMQKLREAASMDEALRETLSRVENALFELEDVARDLERYADRLEGEDDRLDAIEERLALIQRLSRKHGTGVEAILARLHELKEEARILLAQAEQQQKIDGEVEAAQQEAEGIARKLSQARATAANRFSQEIAAVLHKLGMAKAQMEIILAKHTPSANDLVIDGGRLGPNGADRIEICFAPNVGEGSKPLHRIASGGELSRVTLAAKVVLAQADPCSTSVYDEVDTGVGGRTARVLGELLQSGAKGRQVLCITHLAQVAAAANTHLLVEKKEVNGRVVSTVRALEPGERVSELSRMMGGGGATSRSLAHAEELLREAQDPTDTPQRPNLTLIAS